MMNPVSITMDGNKTVIAKFAENQTTYTLDVSIVGQGTVSESPKQAS